MDARARARACIQQPTSHSEPLHHDRPRLCTLEQHQHPASESTIGATRDSTFTTNLPRVLREQAVDAGGGRVLEDVRAGEDPPACRAARRRDDHEARVNFAPAKLPGEVLTQNYDLTGTRTWSCNL